MSGRFFIAVLVVALVACGDDDASPDASSDASSDASPDASSCAACDDGLACNGVERCTASGCEDGVPPCDGPCDELRGCIEECTTDADGDGAISVACGGTDCDDDDPNVRPGATEVCDEAGRDEDCDPETLGGRDADEDGFVDAACCNGDRCGDDCDDTRADLAPGQTETCDGVDQDCDGSIDEGVTIRYVRDADGDGYGDAAPDATFRDACAPPEGFARAATDCDDTDPNVHPGAFDRCDGEVDDDCNGTPNDPPGGCACVLGASRGCPLPGACAASTQFCTEGGWSACGVGPTIERCANELDDDCDGVVDEGCPCDVAMRACGTDVGLCEVGTQRCAAEGWSGCEGSVVPSIDVCNTQDDDCDGLVDEGVALLCYRDLDRDGFAWAAAEPTPVCAETCPIQTTARAPGSMPDCDDEDGRAFPGQTRFFDFPRPNGSFDFDCDGTIAVDSPGTACTTNAAWGCTTSARWTNDPARCGQDIEKGFCGVVGPSGGTFCVERETCLPFDPGSCGDRLRCR